MLLQLFPTCFPLQLEVCFPHGLHTANTGQFPHFSIVSRQLLAQAHAPAARLPPISPFPPLLGRWAPMLPICTLLYSFSTNEFSLDWPGLTSRQKSWGRGGGGCSCWNQPGAGQGFSCWTGAGLGAVGVPCRRGGVQSLFPEVAPGGILLSP